MKTRRIAREKALQSLYQRDLSQAAFEDSREEILRDFRSSGGAGGYCSDLLEGVLSNRDELDAIIVPYLENWTLQRMSVVDRNLLRLAVFELRYLKDTPFKVVISEAVAIAKKFGTDDSAAFVNGVLDKIATSVKAAN